MFNQRSLFALGLSTVFSFYWLAIGISGQRHTQAQNFSAQANPTTTPTPKRRPSPSVPGGSGNPGPVPGGPGGTAGPVFVPNFTGTWVLDKSKSQELSQRMMGADKVTLTITQDDKTISLDTKIEGGQAAGGGPGGGGGGMGGGRPPAGPTPYNLNGYEVIGDVNVGQAIGKRTMKATMSGSTLELMSKINFIGQDGTDRVSATTQKLSLSGDGKTLTIVTHREGSQQQQPDTIAVYIKQ